LLASTPPVIWWMSSAVCSLQAGQQAPVIVQAHLVGAVQRYHGFFQLVVIAARWIERHRRSEGLMSV
jgi:hypothetical protein